MTERTHAYGKVAVLLGGLSAEREVSLNSGQAMLKALTDAGVDAHPVDPQSDDLQTLKHFDCALIALHGRGGEDGLIQALLEWMQVPYSGSGVQASALAMDKLRTKLVWQALGLKSAEFALIRSQDQQTDENRQAIIERLGLPLIVKPVHEGSSVGISKVNSADELPAALARAANHDNEILIERWIQGEEYAVTILGDRVLPSVRIQPANEFYDYQAKYESTETRYFCPSGLSADDEAAIGKLAGDAFRALGCEGWGRVDFLRDTVTGEFYLIEANTVPGMTETSLVPKAARQAGLSFTDLVLEILDSARRSNS